MNKQTQQNNGEEQVMVSAASERAEALSGILIAFFAAMMAISDLVNNNIEEEMQKAQSNHGSYFSWYQSKSVKQSLQESQLGTLETLVKTGIVKPEKTAAIDEEIGKIKIEIKRYKAEKKEIMDGSSTLKPEEWIQELDGKKGVIIGVKEWEKMHEKLDVATNKFDIGMLFFQISLVLGAICVVIYDNPKLQRAFILMMIGTGIFGVVFSIWGYLLSL